MEANRKPRVWSIVKRYWIQDGNVVDGKPGSGDEGQPERPKDGTLAIIISSTGGYRPLFSVSLGTVSPHGLNPNISMRTEVVDGFQHKVRNVAEDAAKLFARAEEYIAVEKALSWDGEIERKIERETKQLNHGKVETRVTGKTAKKKAKLAARATT